MNEEEIKRILGEQDEFVKWSQKGYQIAKEHGKSLENMIYTLKCAWYMNSMFELFAKGDKNGE